MDLDIIKAKLHTHNFRLTLEREVVLVAFIQSGRMLTPSQLHTCVRETSSKVGLTTVYRLLEALTKTRLATPFLIDGEIYYTFCTDRHHHHFVCLGCHHVRDIYDCSSAVIEQDHTIGKVDYHRVDLYGQCVECEEGGSPC